MKHPTACFAFAFVALLCPYSSHAALVDGLVARYDLNGNANDSSGFGNHGAVAGPILTSDRFGSPNSAYSFDGVDDYIQIPESTAFDSFAFSISLWFRAESFPVQAGMLISKGQNNFEIHTAAEEFTGLSAMKFLPRFVAEGVTMDWYTPADVYGLGQWTHVVGVYNPGVDIQLYVNGIDVPLSGPNDLFNAPDNLLDARLGSRTDGTLFFHGDIDDVRIYDRVLSASEVSELFMVPEPNGVLLASAGLFALVVCRRTNMRSRKSNSSARCQGVAIV